MRCVVEEAEVVLRVLRLEMEVAEKWQVSDEQGAEQTARKGVAGSGMMRRLAPKLLLPPRIPTSSPPPATHTEKELTEAEKRRNNLTDKTLLDLEGASRCKTMAKEERNLRRLRQQVEEPELAQGASEDSGAFNW